MNIKDIKFFRQYYKEVVRGITNDNRNPNFVGTSSVIDGKQTYGFYELYHGDKVNIDNHITMYLDMAQDWQAVYEFLQNAYDSNSSTFGLFCDNDYLFVFNNGDQFSFEGIRSILNIGQSTKESKSNIGRFGVGFKIVHRLIGETNGKNELRNYQGPILFSWSNYNDLKDLLMVKSVEDIIEKQPDMKSSTISDTYSINYDYPWLFKILLTNFPCSPRDKILDLDGNLRENIFSEEELLKLKLLTKKYLFDNNKFSEEQLLKGTIIFLKLGFNKSDKLVKEHIKSGIRYSLSILNTSQQSTADSRKMDALYFNDIESPYLPANIFTLQILINRDDKDYQLLTSDLDITEKPETVEFVFGFPQKLIDDSIKQFPNFYLYFPLSEELHNFNFVLHCNIFHNLSQRTNLAESERNRKIFDIFVSRFLNHLDLLKTSDSSKYECIFSSLLLSNRSDKQNKQWVNNLLYNKILVYIRANIPSSENNYSPKDKVRIKETALQIIPRDFGVKSYEWFWNNDTRITSEARNSSKLDIKSASLCTLIEESSDISLISKWLSANNEVYQKFIEELNDQKNFQPLYENIREHYVERGRVYSRTVQRETKFRRHLYSLQFILSDNGISLSPFEIKNNFNFILISSNSAYIKQILIKLGFGVSEINVSDYPQIKKMFEKDFPYISDKTKLFDIIKSKTATNVLKPEEKKQLFYSFSDIDLELISRWVIFKNQNDQYCSIQTLLSPKKEYEEWFNGYVVNRDEYFDQLESILLNNTHLYSKLIVPQWTKLTQSQNVTENIEDFYECVVKYFDIDSDKTLISGSLIYCYNRSFKENNLVFYNEYLKDSTNYGDLSKLITKMAGLYTPYQSILKYLSVNPFDLKNQDIFDYILKDTMITKVEFKILLEISAFSKSNVFSKIIIAKQSNNVFRLMTKKDSHYQYYASSKYVKLNTFLERELPEEYVLLDEEIYNMIQNKTDLLSEKDVYIELFNSEILNTHALAMLDIVEEADSIDIKIEYLKKLKTLLLSENKSYEPNSFEYRVIDLAYHCISSIPGKYDSDIAQSFRNNIRILDSTGNTFPLNDVVMNNNVTFNIDDSKYRLELSKILPTYSNRSGLIEKLIANFKDFSDYNLRWSIFKVGKEKSKKEIVNEIDKFLSNAQQLAFIILYYHSVEDFDELDKFEYIDIDGNRNLFEHTSYYLEETSYIERKNILHKVYNEISGIMNMKEEKPSSYICTDFFDISNKPYLDRGIFYCVGLSSNFKNDPKLQEDLLGDLFSSFIKQLSVCDSISFCVTPPLDNNENTFENIFGFDINKKVLTKNYCHLEEILPDWISSWIENEDYVSKSELLKALGVMSDDSPLIKLRKHLSGELYSYEMSDLHSLIQEDIRTLENTIFWLMTNKVEFLSNSIQYQYLSIIYQSIGTDSTMVLPMIMKINQDRTYVCQLKTFNPAAANWYLDSEVINELSIIDTDILLNIYECLNQKEECLYDFDILSSEFKENVKANKITIIKELNDKELVNSRIEYDADYYRIWKHEINNKFTIHKVSNLQYALPYVVKFNNHEVKVIYDQTVDIDVDGNIYFISESEEIEKLLINILNKNGFTEEYLDLLNEKKQNEPEEIAKQYDDIHSQPSFELNRITEESVNIYFPPNEVKSFEEKLIELLNIQTSPWGNGYIFHFSNLDNAANIISKSLILSRKYANDFMFNDSASNEQINRTRNNIHNFARFYFRPHTPTQWHNEGLGRRRYHDNPKCPAPVFFKIRIEDVLKSNPGKCFVSNGNLSSDWATIGNSYDFLRKFDFLNLFSRFGNSRFMYASQQEFIVEHSLSLNNIEYEVICKDEQDKYSLINLVQNDISDKVDIDRSFYHYENPFIIVESGSDRLCIKSSQMVGEQYDLLINSNEEIKFSKIEGIVSLFQRSETSAIQIHINSSHPKVQIDLTEKTPFTIYYIDKVKKAKWLIFSDAKIKKTLIDGEARENEKMIQQIISLDKEFFELYDSQVRHYKLKDHVILVLNEFDKYFSNSNYNGILSKDKFKLFLAIHDIGKPAAERLGNRNNQHYYSLEIFKRIGKDLSLDELEYRIFISLLSSDPIGKYFQGAITLEDANRSIDSITKVSNISLNELFYLLTIYYQVDAGSYTKDAGGIKYLEFIFKYENGKKVYSNIERRLLFSDKYEILYKKLEETLFI